MLAPGGRHVFSVWDGGYNRHARIADEVAAQFFPTDPPQFYRVGTGYNKIDPIKDSLSDAGFLDLRIAVLAREKQVADIKRLKAYEAAGADALMVRGLDDACCTKEVQTDITAMWNELCAICHVD
jgi:2-methylisocitrate lyase-like PEP mutase family enzyme